MNDLDLVAWHDAALGVARARDDSAVHLDRDRSFGQAEVVDETAHGEVLGHIAMRAIDGDPHEEKLTSP